MPEHAVNIVIISVTLLLLRAVGIVYDKEEANTLMSVIIAMVTRIEYDVAYGRVGNTTRPASLL